jgi:hypothetical protein
VTLVGTKTYKLGVNAVTNTEIRATLGGGVTGAYKVIVSKLGAATAVPNPATANDLKYEMVITSISPVEGSKFGGTEITITGRGFPFSDKDLTAVIFGEVSNNFCQVKTSTLNQVVCTSPGLMGNQTVGTALKLHLYGRYIKEASCDPATACDFTFKDTATPSVTFPSSKVIVPGQSQTWTVSGLGASPKLFFNDTEVTISSSTGSSVTFTYPQLTAGVYTVKLQGASGYTDSAVFALACTLNPAFPSTKAISPEGGSFTITGIGFAGSLDQSGLSTKLNDKPFVFDSMGYTSMSFTVPPFSGGVTSQKVTFSAGTCSQTFTFTALAATQTINFATSSFPFMNAVPVPFTVSSGTLLAVKLYKINNLGVKTDIIVAGAVSGSNVEFTGISVGEYMVFASYADGFYKPNSTITITTTTTPTVTSSQWTPATWVANPSR